MANGQVVAERRYSYTLFSHPPTRRAGESHWGHQPRVYLSGCPVPPPLLLGNPQSLFITLLFPPKVPIPMTTNGSRRPCLQYMQSRQTFIIQLILLLGNTWNVRRLTESFWRALRLPQQFPDNADTMFALFRTACLRHTRDNLPGQHYLIISAVSWTMYETISGTAFSSVPDNADTIFAHSMTALR